MQASGQEQCLIRDEHRYCAHPHMAKLRSGTWLLVATCGPRRAVTMHPPQDPEFVTVLISSQDEGRTWSAPVVAPRYGMTGMECAGLTALPDGAVLLNQWRFHWHPWTAVDRLEEPSLQEPEALKRSLLRSSELESQRVADIPAERLLPWARGGGDTLVHRSDDDGRSWNSATVIDPAPYSGGYGMRGAVVLPDGEILLPLSDVPHYARIFLVRSNDGGRSWGAAEPVAAIEGLEFEEPAPLILADGTLVLALRENVSRTLFVVRSSDGGKSWPQPAATGIETYPAHLVALPDGRIIAVTGRRRQPFGIVLYFSTDGGLSFDRQSPLAVRSNLPNKDLGYPTAALRSDGSLLVAYYYRDAAGVAGVYAIEVAL